MLIDQPETFYTINYIKGLEYKGVPVLLILGGALFAVSLSVVIINKIYKRNNLIVKILPFMFFLFWLPLFFNFFYNNVYDLKENVDYFKLDNSERKILRLCNIDHRQNSGGVWCQLINFSNFTKQQIPKNSDVTLISSPVLEPFLRYYLFPEVTLNNEYKKSDYLIFYFPEKLFFYENNILYEGAVDEDKAIGKYELIGAMGKSKFILRKFEISI